MGLKFNINRPPVNDDEINKNKNFEELVKQFKSQSLKKAQADETWWKNKKIKYSAVIAGITVVCTITYLSISNSKQTVKQDIDDKISTQKVTAKPSPKRCVNPPSKTLKLTYTTYKISTNKDAKLTHKSGTKITIPKNSLVNKSGRELVGEVTIEYKEMQDLGDVVLSGIPMDYDSSGIKFQFESAGMFDIRAYQNGEPVFVKPGKELEIQLVSNNSVDKFNQYYLDTLQHNWTYLKRDNLPSANLGDFKTNQTLAITQSKIKIEQLNQEITKVIPGKIDSVQRTCKKVIKALPTPTSPKKPVKSSNRPNFIIEASADDFPELAGYESMRFEVAPENTTYTKEMHDITWTDVKILPGPDKGKNYILQLSYRSRVEKLLVYPVLSGADYEKAQKNYQLQFEKYEVLREQRLAKETQLMNEMQVKQAEYLQQQQIKQAEYTKEKARLASIQRAKQQNELNALSGGMSNKTFTERLFRINQFGIYNSDCPHPQQNSNHIKPIFVFEGKEGFFVPDQVNLIDYDTKIVTMSGLQDGFDLGFSNDKNYSICLFRNDKVFICSKDNFKKTVESKSNKFNIVALPESANNVADFKKALEL